MVRAQRDSRASPVLGGRKTSLPELCNRRLPPQAQGATPEDRRDAVDTVFRAGIVDLPSALGSTLTTSGIP